MDVDVVIIGAGLAGLSAANQVASSSRASVVIIEKRWAGSNNPTTMTFADVPERFGLEPYVIGRYNRFTFHSPLGGRSSHTFQDFPLAALDYQPSCLSLLDRATTAGNVWLYAAAVTGLHRRQDRWEVMLNDGRQLSTPLVIDASGRSLFTSRALGLPRPRSYSHCLGARLVNCPAPDPQESFFFAPYERFGNGGGWLYPLDGDRVSVGYATLNTTSRMPGRELKANFKRFLAEFEPYKSWFHQAKLDHSEVGTIPIYPLQRLIYDGLLIAGDAAGQATIWSCMGSEAALHAGQLAGEAAVAALKTGRFGMNTLGQYQRNWDDIYRRTYQHNAWIAPVVWNMSGKEWNRQISLVQQLTPEQMVDRLRYNWPVPTLPQAVFVRAYDLAGRARRGLVRRIRRIWNPRRQVLAEEK